MDSAEKKRRRFEDIPSEDAPDEAPAGEESPDVGQSMRVMQHVVALLKPEEVTQLLVRAAATVPEVSKMVCEEVGKDKQNRKLFVRGLDFDSTAESVFKVFTKYGSIAEHTVIKDRMTGKSRGFGFITFTSMESTVKALQEPSKLIDGRMSICQLAVLGNKIPQEDILMRKIFVANVHSDISAERMLECFSQFGEIDEGPIGFDRTTRKSKGYALIVYKTAEGASRALQEPNKVIDGHEVFCKLAGDPKGKLSALQQNQFQQNQFQQQQPGVLQNPDSWQPPLLQYQQQQAAQGFYQPAAYPGPSAVPGQPASYTQPPLASVPPQQPQQEQQQQQQQLYALPAAVNGGASGAAQAQYGYTTMATTPLYVTPSVQTQATYLPSSAPAQSQAGAGGYYMAATAGPAGYTLLQATPSQPAGLISLPGQQQQGLVGARNAVLSTPVAPSPGAAQGYYQSQMAGGQLGYGTGTAGLPAVQGGAHAFTYPRP